LNPQGPTHKACFKKKLQHPTLLCGLFAEQKADNPLAILARKWSQLSLPVQAALRALIAALEEGSHKGAQTHVG
jgi:hypothetical protein